MIGQRFAPKIDDAFESPPSRFQIRMPEAGVPFAPRAEPAKIDESDWPGMIEMTIHSSEKCREPFAVKSISGIRDDIFGLLHAARLLFLVAQTIQNV